MDIKNLHNTIKTIRENTNKRNFSQSFELIINLKDLNVKKSDEAVDFFAVLHNDKGKKVKVCAFVGAELEASSKKNCDLTITEEEFPKFQKDKKALKKLAKTYDFFVAQANIMPKVAASFGRVLGPRSKMPNPKAGCVVPPNANLESLVAKLNKTIHIKAKVESIIQCSIGNEAQDDAVLCDNINVTFNSIVHNLPKEKNNVKNIFLKTTMGKSFPIDDKGVLIPQEKKVEETAPAKVTKKAEPKESAVEEGN